MKKKINVAIIGCGVVGSRRKYFIERNKLFKLVAISDIKFRKIFFIKQGIFFYKSYENLLKKNSIDAVFITLPNYLAAKDLNLANIAFLGNDINDLEVMEIVGISLCPKDAHIIIKEIAQITLKSKGGEGVIRELFDLMSNNFRN